MNNIESLVRHLSKALLLRHWSCAAAESCTGGSLAAALTALSGSSRWFDRGFVTYSNEAKEDMLQVPHDLIQQHGAVSDAVACAMAKGAILQSKASIAVAITGIAGPSGGSIEKPVGTVWIAWAQKAQPTVAHHYFYQGDRHSIRQQAVEAALLGLIKQL